MDLKIEHNKERQQFYAVIDGKTALLDYSILPDRKTLNYRHTFTPPELRGRQIAAAITKFALDYAIENNFKVIPGCPYVRKYVDEHPEYSKVVSDEL